MGKGTEFGYRLFTVGLRQGYGNKEKAYRTKGFYGPENDASVTWSAIDDIYYIADSNLERKYFHPLKLSRYYVENPAEDDDAKVICLVSVTRSGNRLDFEFKWGKKGSHDEALRKDGEEDIPLDGTAPSNRYYASLYFPADAKGTTAILVAEARGRTNVGPNLLKYIACLMEEHADNSFTDEGKTRWWNFTVRSISDSERLKQQLQAGELQRVTLKKYTTDPLKGRPIIDMEFNQHIFDAKAEANVMEAGLAWLGYAEKYGKAIESEVAVKSLGQYVTDEVKDVDWDTGSFVFESPDGKNTTITPENLNAFFIYPLQRKNRPTHRQVRENAEGKLLEMQRNLGIQLDL